MDDAQWWASHNNAVEMNRRRRDRLALETPVERKYDERPVEVAAPVKPRRPRRKVRRRA